MSYGIKSSETDGPAQFPCVLYAFKNMPHFAIVRISVAAILFPVEIMGEPTPDLESAWKTDLYMRNPQTTPNIEHILMMIYHILTQISSAVCPINTHMTFFLKRMKF